MPKWAAGPGPLSLSVRPEPRYSATQGPSSLAGEGSFTDQRNGNAGSMESPLQALRIIEAQQSSSGTLETSG
jgi:hypothetical protein